MMEYNFNPALAFALITKDWFTWAEKTHAKKFILGLSGGKDSSVTAALAVKIFGSENVVGVFMPCGEANAEDEALVEGLCKNLNIDYYICNIGNACSNLYANMGISPSKDTTINLPARVRMSMLYAYGQTLNARVLCTGNLSENIIGYATIYGDHAGAYSPLAQLTVQEVIQLGEWLGLESKYTRKIPDDGLCGETDEQKLGFTYAALDEYIRTGKYEDENVRRKWYEMYEKNKFKLEIVNIPSPRMPWANKFEIYEDVF